MYTAKGRTTVRMNRKGDEDRVAGTGVKNIVNLYQRKKKEVSKKCEQGGRGWTEGGKNTKTGGRSMVGMNPQKN